MPQAQAEGKLRQKNGIEQTQRGGASKEETAPNTAQSASSDTPSSSGIARKLSEARSDPVDKVYECSILRHRTKRACRSNRPVKTYTPARTTQSNAHMTMLKVQAWFGASGIAMHSAGRADATLYC